MRILVVGPLMCGKTLCIKRMSPSENIVYRYSELGYSSYTVTVRDTKVAIIDMVEEEASPRQLSEACVQIDGALIFVVDPTDYNLSTSVAQAAPKNAIIERIAYSSNRDIDPARDSLKSHIETLVDRILASRGKTQTLEKKPSEIHLLFIPNGEKCQAYDTIEDAHAAIAERFVFPIIYKSSQYYGFEAEPNNYILLTSSAACVAAIIQRGIARVCSGTMHTE